MNARAFSVSENELLVGTRKGLFVLRGPPGAAMEITSRQFEGQVVEYAIRDRRTRRYFASVTNGQFGPHLYYGPSPEGPWEEADGPSFPEGTEASVDRVWVVTPGEAEGQLWAGVAPAALFESRDGGVSWKLNEALWNDPTRERWEGGLGGLCLHSICPWPGDPQRLSLAISAVGVWHTDDGGGSWGRGVEGLVPGYLPEAARENTLMHCVHKLERSAGQPSTFYMQFHGGVYRSDDSGETWNDIGMVSGLPAEFGFPIVADPHDPDRAYVIPLVADTDRVTPEGKVRVYVTDDRGASWQPRTQGLPQNDAYLTILRQSFCHDGRDPLGLYFGAESGEVFASGDGGDSWTLAADHLPPITSVRCA